MGYPVWILTVDMTLHSYYFMWDCPLCESNINYATQDFLGTHFNEDYVLGVF
jgi:hypothetical protein